MKKTIYIAAFTILGILVQFLVHVVIEVWYIKMLITNFNKYNFGLSWQQWFTVHHVGTVILLILGAALGYWQGKFWWKKIYENRKD